MTHLEKAAPSLLTGALAAAIAPEGQKLRKTTGAMLGDTIGGFAALAAIAPHLYNSTNPEKSQRKIRAFADGQMGKPGKLRAGLQRTKAMVVNPKTLAAMLGGSALGGTIGYNVS